MSNLWLFVAIIAFGLVAAGVVVLMAWRGRAQ